MHPRTLIAGLQVQGTHAHEGEWALGDRLGRHSWLRWCGVGTCLCHGARMGGEVGRGPNYCTAGLCEGGGGGFFEVDVGGD